MQYYLAQTETGYGCANYGETNEYNSCEVSGAQTNQGGSLINTGSPASFALCAGIILIAIVLAIKLWPTKKK